MTAPSGAMRGSPPEPAAASASAVFCSSFFCLSKTNPVSWTYCSVTHWAEVLDPTPLPLSQTKCLTSSLLPPLFNINAPWKKNSHPPVLRSHTGNDHWVSFSTLLHLIQKLGLPGKYWAFCRLLFHTESYFEVLSSWKRLCAVKWDLHIWWE